jgi:hypothetical protein
MTIKEYLAKLPGTDAFLALPDTDQDRWIFMAQETLGDEYPARKISDRAVALQTLYMFEGDAEDFAMLKRQGVDQFSTEGLSVSFKSGAIAPQVIDIISGGRARVGRLI